jgi:hypothetical protein
MTPLLPRHSESVAVKLSVDAARFLQGCVAHMNTIKVLPEGSPEALQTSAWLEEIGACTEMALLEYDSLAAELAEEED